MVAIDPGALLAAERERALGQIAALSRDFEIMVQAAAHVSTDDEHDPDGATLAYERAQVDALLSLARGRLAHVDRALERLAAGTYGWCQGCGAPIPAERLAARPVAERCVACAGAAQRKAPG